MTRKYWGLLGSVLCHGLILIIPVSLAPAAPQTFPPVEFVMTLAEKPMISEPPPPEPKKVEPKKKTKPRPQPRRVRPEPVEAKSFMPQPPPVPAPRPRPTPAPAPVSAGPHLTEFGSATGPAFIRRVMPVYPERARRMGREGLVVLRLTIDARGNLVKVQVVEGPGYGFEDSALAAVKGSAFRPAMVKGEAVASIARLPIRFRLK